MQLRPLASLIALAVVLNGCAAGGGTTNSGSTLPAALSVPVSSARVATGTLTFAVPQSSASTSSTARKTAYVSPGATYATLFIDGATPGTRKPCMPATTTTGTCSIDWQSTAGSHTFTAEVDAGGTQNGGGTVLADGTATESLTPGDNGTLAPITLNGVAASVKSLANTLYPSGDPQCTNALLTGNCYLVTIEVLDAVSDLIYQPGTFDNDIEIASTDFTISNHGWYGFLPSATGGFTNLAFGCVAGQTGTFTLFGAAVNGSPSVPATGALSAAEISSNSLLYPFQYPFVATGFATFQCTNGTIVAAGIATGSVPVQSLTH
jgi:hypothetical protein